MFNKIPIKTVRSLLRRYTQREENILNYLRLIIYTVLDKSNINVAIGHVTDVYEHREVSYKGFVSFPEQGKTLITFDTELFDYYSMDSKEETVDKMSELLETLFHEMAHVWQFENIPATKMPPKRLSHPKELYQEEIRLIQRYMENVLMGTIPYFTINFYETGISNKIKSKVDEIHFDSAILRGN